MSFSPFYKRVEYKRVEEKGKKHRLKRKDHGTVDEPSSE